MIALINKFIYLCYYISTNTWLVCDSCGFRHQQDSSMTLHKQNEHGHDRKYKSISHRTVSIGPGELNSGLRVQNRRSRRSAPYTRASASSGASSAASSSSPHSPPLPSTTLSLTTPYTGPTWNHPQSAAASTFGQITPSSLHSAHNVPPSSALDMLFHPTMVNDADRLLFQNTPSDPDFLLGAFYSPAPLYQQSEPQYELANTPSLPTDGGFNLLESVSNFSLSSVDPLFNTDFWSNNPLVIDQGLLETNINPTPSVFSASMGEAPFALDWSSYPSETLEDIFDQFRYSSEDF